MQQYFDAQHFIEANKIIPPLIARMTLMTSIGYNLLYIFVVSQHSSLIDPWFGLIIVIVFVRLFDSIYLVYYHMKCLQHLSILFNHPDCNNLIIGILYAFQALHPSDILSLKYVTKSKYIEYIFFIKVLIFNVTTFIMMLAYTIHLIF